MKLTNKILENFEGLAKGRLMFAVGDYEICYGDKHSRPMQYGFGIIGHFIYVNKAWMSIYRRTGRAAINMLLLYAKTVARHEYRDDILNTLRVRAKKGESFHSLLMSELHSYEEDLELFKRGDMDKATIKTYYKYQGNFIEKFIRVAYDRVTTQQGQLPFTVDAVLELVEKALIQRELRAVSDMAIIEFNKTAAWYDEKEPYCEEYFKTHELLGVNCEVSRDMNIGYSIYDTKQRPIFKPMYVISA